LNAFLIISIKIIIIFTSKVLYFDSLTTFQIQSIYFLQNSVRFFLFTRLYYFQFNLMILGVLTLVDIIIIIIIWWL